MKKIFHTEEEWETLINKYRNTRTLTKEMVNAFVEKNSKYMKAVLLRYVWCMMICWKN